jgi:hypothetical protein
VWIVAVLVSEPETNHHREARSRSGTLSGLALPGLLVVAWVFALSGTAAPGAVHGESTAMSDLRWILYFTGFVFLFSSVMHSVFHKSMAASIGWKTNGFQYEIAAVSLGLGGACFYAVYHGIGEMVTVSLPIVSFLFLAGVNHLVEIVRKKNYAPNNTLILVWDFGVPISLVALLISIGRF